MCKHHIETGDVLPMTQAPYRESFEIEEFLREHVRKRLEMGIIEQIDSPGGGQALVV